MTNRELLLLTKARRLARTGEGQRIRTGSGLSLREVAGAVGMPTTTLWRWERGERKPHGPAAVAWCQLLDEVAGHREAA